MVSMEEDEDTQVFYFDLPTELTASGSDVLVAATADDDDDELIIVKEVTDVVFDDRQVQLHEDTALPHLLALLSTRRNAPTSYERFRSKAQSLMQLIFSRTPPSVQRPVHLTPVIRVAKVRYSDSGAGMARFDIEASVNREALFRQDLRDSVPPLQATSDDYILLPAALGVDADMDCLYQWGQPRQEETVRVLKEHGSVNLTGFVSPQQASSSSTMDAGKQLEMLRDLEPGVTVQHVLLGPVRVLSVDPTTATLQVGQQQQVFTIHAFDVVTPHWNLLNCYRPDTAVQITGLDRGTCTAHTLRGLRYRPDLHLAALPAQRITSVHDVEALCLPDSRPLDNRDEAMPILQRMARDLQSVLRQSPEKRKKNKNKNKKQSPNKPGGGNTPAVVEPFLALLQKLRTSTASETGGKWTSALKVASSASGSGARVLWNMQDVVDLLRTNSNNNSNKSKTKTKTKTNKPVCYYVSGANTSSQRVFKLVYDASSGSYTDGDAGNLEGRVEERATFQDGSPAMPAGFVTQLLHLASLESVPPPRVRTYNLPMFPAAAVEEEDDVVEELVDPGTSTTMAVAASAQKEEEEALAEPQTSQQAFVMKFVQMFDAQTQCSQAFFDLCTDVVTQVEVRAAAAALLAEDVTQRTHLHKVLGMMGMLAILRSEYNAAQDKAGHKLQIQVLLRQCDTHLRYHDPVFQSPALYSLQAIRQAQSVTTLKRVRLWAAQHQKPLPVQQQKQKQEEEEGWRRQYTLVPLQRTIDGPQRMVARLHQLAARQNAATQTPADSDSLLLLTHGNPTTLVTAGADAAVAAVAAVAAAAADDQLLAFLASNPTFEADEMLQPLAHGQNNKATLDRLQHATYGNLRAVSPELQQLLSSDVAKGGANSRAVLREAVAFVCQDLFVCGARLASNLVYQEAFVKRRLKLQHRKPAESDRLYAFQKQRQVYTGGLENPQKGRALMAYLHAARQGLVHLGIPLPEAASVQQVMQRVMVLLYVGSCTLLHIQRTVLVSEGKTVQQLVARITELYRQRQRQRDETPEKVQDAYEEVRELQKQRQIRAYETMSEEAKALQRELKARNLPTLVDAQMAGDPLQNTEQARSEYISNNTDDFAVRDEDGDPDDDDFSHDRDV